MQPHWLLLIATIALGGLLVPFGRLLLLWLHASLSGTDIRLLSLIMMPLRKVDATVIVRAKVMAVQAGLATISTNAIEAQYLAGGDVQRVMLALVSAHHANIDLDWNTAAAIDLAGRNILEAVQVCVNPKVIHCPTPGNERRNTLDAVARDGIQLKIRVLVTVRTNLSHLIGGATEPTVVARVSQGIISAIGACESYCDALADPALITRLVVAKGLDSQTSFSIVSIDVADIGVGANVGAQLRLDQANGDINVARALAEQRRAMAVARQQEMVALTRAHQALIVLAETQIPPAIATAYRKGQLRTQGSQSMLTSQRSVARRLSSRERPAPATTARTVMTGQVEVWEAEGGQVPNHTHDKSSENAYPVHESINNPTVY